MPACLVRISRVPIPDSLGQRPGVWLCREPSNRNLKTVTSCPKLSWCLSRPIFTITAIKDVQKLINIIFSWRNCNRPERPCDIQNKADRLKTAQVWFKSILHTYQLY
ncbi:hypothetical protein PILCRDRAFT_306337 [Piloderma croceum F 1598]|uniref:Uncharacterized protein n=1 Tax=Piloderma croceum (strain F 1598) TaxID=765440 RepID=A0A0C3G3M7_PILCF|nr:hypothetical protein PILCRDRAFT_306337 [Piloderma croceum F 1598]